MIRSYPRVSQFSQLDDVVGEECELCGNAASRTVRIEYNEKRSDDDVFDVCAAHYKTAHVDPVSFVGEYIQLTMEQGDDET